MSKVTIRRTRKNTPRVDGKCDVNVIFKSIKSMEDAKQAIGLNWEKVPCKTGVKYTTKTKAGNTLTAHVPQH